MGKIRLFLTDVDGSLTKLQAAQRICDKLGK